MDNPDDSGASHIFKFERDDGAQVGIVTDSTHTKARTRNGPRKGTVANKKKATGKT